MRVPEHRVGGSNVKYSNYEQSETAYIRDAITPIVNKIEQRFSKQLLSKKERKHYEIKHNMNELYRGDMLTRAQVELIKIQGGAYSRNEIREWNGDSPKEGLDEYMVPLNHTTVSLLEAMQNDANSEDEKNVIGNVIKMMRNNYAA